MLNLKSVFYLLILVFISACSTPLKKVHHQPPTTRHPSADGQVDFDNLEVCPDPENNEALKVGDSCKVLTVETHGSQGVKISGGSLDRTLDPMKLYRPEDDGGYQNEEQGDVYAQWTLVKKEGSRKIWEARTLKREPVYVGSVEDDYYSFEDAKKVCDRTEEIVLNGKTHQIKMTLPEIGFGRSDIDNPLNFEFLTYLNFKSVVSNRGSSNKDRRWFWSSSPVKGWKAVWLHLPNSCCGVYIGSGSLLTLKQGGENYSVRCVGR